jgi:ABC-type sugar transport system ATPase subunit
MSTDVVLHCRPPVILAAERLFKRFHATQAVADVSLSLEPGEVHAIVGENGAGKSTLIKLLSGVHQPDAGRLLLRGVERRFPTPRAAMAEGIVLIPQELRLVPMLTVAENVMLGHWPARRVLGILCTVDRPAVREAAARALARLGVAPDLDAPGGTLPYAERQLVAIARALAHEAAVLILDEPTAALERREVRRLFEVIAALKAHGVAIIYISHRLDEVVELADRCTVLRDGRVVATVARGAFDTERLIAAMTGGGLTHDQIARERAMPPMGETLLEAEISGRRPVRLTVRARETVGVVGLLGSGASALLRGMFAAGDAIARVSVRGRSRRLSSPAAAIDAGIGLVPSERAKGLVLDMSVRDNIVLPSLRRLRGRAAAALVTSLMEALDIRPRGIHVPARALSGGNQQKVVFAKWLAARVEVLLLDEPTQGIDVAAKAAIHRLMREFAERGGGVLVTSAELEEVLGASDRVLAMRAGEIVADLARDEDVTERELRRILGG